MKIAVRAHELAKLPGHLPDGLTTLSLDCFDTLLWRDVEAPRDVFAGIALPGGGLEPRMWAEGAARKASALRHGRAEVDFTAIYRRMMPAASPAEIAAAIDHELTLEARHCFAFAPTVALMRAAKARGLNVVIVSDTYLDEQQLSTLIERAAGADVRALIDRIFASSAHGMSKGEGLFAPVVEALGVRPDTILHCGDNRHADQIAPDRLGIHTVHIVQFDEETERRLRFEGAAAAMIDPAVRITVPVHQPHRAEIASRADTDAATVLGHDVLGPIMYNFALWLKAEIAAMSARLGKPVRPLFLMRDGHLPLQVYRALFGDDDGAQPVEISRLVAARATLGDAEAVRAQVEEGITETTPEAIADRLMLYGHEIKRLPTDTADGFCTAITRPEIVEKIVARSRKVADRLIAHLASRGVEQGDAVMLVDLGYNGTVQNLIEPMLVERMGLSVAGRYLLLREGLQAGLDKRGLLDTRHYDMRILHALSGCVAVVEQLSTIAQGSTIDYRDDGEPVRKKADIKGGQSDIREAVQAACLDFARGVGTPVVRVAHRVNDGDVQRRVAASTLARLLFLPMQSEAALLSAFDHDCNLGSTDVRRLLDPDESAVGLRRRGLAYLNEAGRMFVPGELRDHGLPLNLTLFASTRFALDLRNGDFSVGGISLPVILLGADDGGVHRFDAFPTAEGYYRVDVPVAKTRWTPAIQLGAICEWVQLESATWFRLEDFDTKGKPANGEPAATLTDGMAEQAGGLYQCSPTGVLVAPPPAGDEVRILSVVFRPVVRRDAATATRQAA